MGAHLGPVGQIGDSRARLSSVTYNTEPIIQEMIVVVVWNEREDTLGTRSCSDGVTGH